MPQRVPPAWHSDMQLPGKLLLSAAALLLLSLAFRFYRNRSPPGGKIPPGEQRENRDGDGDLRRRRRRRDGGNKSGNGLGMRHADLRGEQRFPGSEEEEEEGEEGSVLGMIPKETPLGPAGTERELGRELGWELGIKSESEAGIEAGRDPGSRTGSELGNELGKEPGIQPGSKLESELGIKPGNNPGRKPGSEPGSKLVTKPGNEYGSEQGSEPGIELGNKLGIKSGSNAGIELGSDPGSKAGKKLGNELGIKAGVEVGSKAGKKLGGKAGIELGSEPGIVLRNKAGIKLGSEPGILLGCELGSEAGVELGSEPGILLASEPGILLGRELGSEAGVELGKEQGILLGRELGSEAGGELGTDPGILLGSELGSEAGVEVGKEPGILLGRELGSEAGGELGTDPGILLGSELGSEAGGELGSEPGILLGSELGSEAGVELGKEPGILLGRELGSEAGGELGKEPGILLGRELGSEAGVELGKEPGILLGRELGSEAGGELGKEPGILLGKEPGILLGSEPGSHAPGAVAGARSSPAGRDAPAPSSGRSPGIGEARTEGDGCARSAEPDPAGGAGRSREGGAGTLRTLSVTSKLGLLLTASEAGSDTSYSFSSVAKIQVEENFIPDRRDKDGDSPAGPGLRGKVYEYFVQSTSESVTRRTSLPFVPAGTSQRRGERGREEPQSSGNHDQNPAVGIPDPNTSAAPQEGLESPPEPPSPDWKCSTLGMAESPQLPLPGEVAAAGPGLSQVPPLSQVHLGNCYDVLRSAKARQLPALQDTALQVMSDHLLQVLRSPDIYGRLNAGERELLLRRRTRGRPRLVVAEIPPAEPGHRRGRLCCYDEDGDRWWQLCQLPAEVAGQGSAVCSMFNYLFVVPGWEGAGRARSPSNRVLCYDPLGDSWRDICPLRQARPRCRLVALDGHLYAIGGECLATVERYDPRRDRWAFVATLPRDAFAVAHAATACDGDIYVTGGTLRSLLLRYDARGDSWATSPAVGDKDKTAELVSAHGFLYRFQLRRGAGGTDVAVSRCSASAGLWYRCGSHALPEPAGLRCAVLGGLVHCLGRDFHLRFLADPVSPRFGAKELRPFPEPRGSLLPAVLVLPEESAGSPRL